MGITKQTYSMEDLVEQDLHTAPSLDIPGLAVERFYMPRDHGKYMLFLVNVEKNSHPKECPYCKESGSMVLAGRTEPRVIHDVVRNNYRVDFIVQPVRLQCKKCGQRHVPKIPGVDIGRSMTTRLLEFLKTECFLQPFTTLSERSGVSVESVRRIMLEETVSYDLARDDNPPIAPRVLGIDEKHIVHSMRGTLVDIESGQLLDLLEDNKKDTMVGAIAGLKDYDTRIEVITTDMNNSYLSWLPTVLPNVTCVIDKFHVIQDVQQKLSSTKKDLYERRKASINKLTDPEEKARQMTILQILANNMRLLNYSMETLVRDDTSDKAKKLATVAEEFPEFRLLRKLYYAVEIMYLKESYEEAEKAWDAWMELLPPSGEKQYKEWCDLYSVVPPMFDEFRSFKRTNFQYYKPFILNYFKPGCRVTNAATEGLNKLIGNIDAAGNGYSFEVLRAKCLYASLVHERRTYGIDVKSVPKWTPTTSYIFSGAYNSSNGKDTYETVYSFTSSTYPVEIETMNVFTENKALLDIIASSPDDEEESEDFIDTKSIIDATAPIFDNMK